MDAFDSIRLQYSLEPFKFWVIKEPDWLTTKPLAFVRYVNVSDVFDKDRVTKVIIAIHDGQASVVDSCDITKYTIG